MAKMNLHNVYGAWIHPRGSGSWTSHQVIDLLFLDSVGNPPCKTGSIVYFISHIEEKKTRLTRIQEMADNAFEPFPDGPSLN